MQKLPPLNAVRAFSVAARCGSFALAGQEMGVTPAAVSQHVRNLETFLGKQLFERHGNRIALTEAGESFYPPLEALMGRLAQLSDEVRSPGGRASLTLSVSPSLAELWLYPRLHGFDMAGIDLRAELDPVDFVGGGIDLRITYGINQYPEHASAPLYADRVVPVCAPGFLTAERRIADLPDRWLIHTDWGPEWRDDPSWRAWFAQIGITRDAAPITGVRSHLTGHAIALAAAGLGIALVPMELTRPSVEQGRLIIPHPMSLAMDGVYGAIWPHARSNLRRLRDLLRHLGVPSIR